MQLTQSILKKIIIYVLLILLVVAFLFPIIWIIFTSIKGPRDAYSLPPKWWGFKPQWENFIIAWGSKKIGESFLNTVIIGMGSVLLTLMLAVPAAYGLSRNRLKMMGNVIIAGLLGIRLLPETLLIIPLYALYSMIKLYDTHLGMIFGFQIFNLPFSIWILRGFLEGLPKELDEAARVDGCSSFKIMTKIIIPLVLPGIASVAILSFIRVWTELLLPLSLTYKNAQTISIAVANFKGYGSFNISLLSAASIIATIPQIIFVIFTQKFIVKGLIFGAVKE